MKLVHRGLLLASLIGLGATTACAAPAPPAFETHTAKASTGVVYTTRASTATKAHLGVAHWHIIKVRGSKAIVLDGADDKGRVVFSSSIAAAAAASRVTRWTRTPRTRTGSGRRSAPGWA